MARDVYFSGKNRVGGTGTAGNPWHGRTASILNAKLRPLLVDGETNVRVHFAEATYETWGVGDIEPEVNNGTYGFGALAGWQFIGVGSGGTILKHVPKESEDYTSRYPTVIQSFDNSLDVQVRDLKIDCNFDQWDAETNAIAGIGVGGRLASGLLVERCQFIGVGSPGIDGSGAIFGYAISQNARRIVIRNCWFHSNASAGGANAIAIGVSSNNHATANPQDASAESLIYGNLIEGDFFHAIGCQGGNMVVRDNHIRGSGSGFGGGYGIYCDTGYLFDSFYESNSISGCYYPICFKTGYYHVGLSQAAVTECQFRNNLIDVTTIGMGICAMNNTDPAILVTYPSGLVSFERNIMAGNRIRYNGGSTGDRHGINVDAVGAHHAGNVAVNNVVDSELLNIAMP